MKWEGDMGASGYNAQTCPNFWYHFDKIGGPNGVFVPATVGETLTVTVRLICGDCIVDLTDRSVLVVDEP